MKVLGFVACHYGLQYMKASLLSIKDHVDKVHMVYSRKPSHGHSTPLVCPDKEWEMRKLAEETLGDKLIWESYEQFNSEIEHRNMRYKHAVGYSLLLTIDLDEVFEQESLAMALKATYTREARFYGVQGYIHFWKFFNYYLADSDQPIRIENLTRDNMDTDRIFIRTYHMSLCQRPEVIEYKMSCYGHKNEIKAGWWDKFNNWGPLQLGSILNLHPTRDDIWYYPALYNGELPESLLFNDYKYPTKMKTLLIPLDYQRHTEDPSLFSNMVESFGRQSETMIYNGDVAACVAEFKPDVIHFQGSLTPEQLKKIKDHSGALVTMWTGDARYAPQQSLLLYKDVVDCFLLPFSGDALKRYQTILGKPCHFIWEPIQNWRFKEPKLMDGGQAVFVGNIYDTMPGGEKRREVLDYVDEQFKDVVYRGNGFAAGDIPYKFVPDMYNRAYITICENNYDDLDEYFTPRNIGALAAGSCALMRYFPGIEKHFQNLNHCIYYRNKHELFEWIAFLKNSPHTRNSIASNGYRLTLENFSYDKWVELYLNIVKNYKS